MTTPTSPATTDPADLAGVFDRYARELLRYCTRRVGEQVAEDVVAETFLVAYEQRHRYDAARGEVLPWLYGIATNLLRRHRRTEIRALRALAHADGGSPVDGPAQRATERVDAARAVARLSAVLAKLPRRQRDVLMLYAVAELEYAEIAAALQIPLGSVQSALHRARAKVRAALAEGDAR
ncbi:RNA polymerase sigma factor [Phytohabitans kaempferiae]|uniref:RNA polymerase sigma factor n=1 Tax=Phytohabitans kaempferiae TaxID=1620943 RepID=A0ABV6M630_9ACTN